MSIYCTLLLLFHVLSLIDAQLSLQAYVVRWDGKNGSTFISSGFPLPPGYVTLQNLSQIVVEVQNVEQAVAISALRGRHPDGSLRSILIQLYYDIPGPAQISAAVQFGAIPSIGRLSVQPV